MVHAAHESHVAGDNAIDAPVTGTTPLLHVQASSLDSAYCELSRAAVHAAHESHVAGDDAIGALVTGTTPLLHGQASSLDSAYCELRSASVFKTMRHERVPSPPTSLVVVGAVQNLCIVAVVSVASASSSENQALDLPKQAASAAPTLLLPTEDLSELNCDALSRRHAAEPADATASIEFRDHVREQEVMTADTELLFADYEFATEWNDNSTTIEKLGKEDAHVMDALTPEWRGFVDPTGVDAYLAQVVSQQSLQLAQRGNSSAYLACEQFADIHSGVQSKSAGEVTEAADPQGGSAGEVNVGDHAKSAGEAPEFMTEVHVYDEDGTLPDKAPYPGRCAVDHQEINQFDHPERMRAIHQLRMRAIHRLAREQIIQAKIRMAEAENENRSIQEFETGEYVMFRLEHIQLPVWAIRPVFHPIYITPSSATAEDKIGSVFEPAEYGVEGILAHRKRHGKTEYLVQWESCSCLQSTWEPGAGLSSAQRILTACNWKSRKIGMELAAAMVDDETRLGHAINRERLYV